MHDNPTLEDVAKHAGVSTATVSRCLNSPDKVVTATRDRVLEAVRALGYAPNFGAQAMAARRTFTVGAVIPTMENAVFARGLQAFQEELKERGYHLMVASSSYQQDLEEEQVRALVARGSEGLLLIGHDRSAAADTFLNQRGLPVVAAWTFDENAYIPSVGFDNRSSMRMLTDRVIALGHRRISVISAPVGDNDRARERVEGVRDAMNAADIPLKNLTVLQTSYGIDSGGDAFERVMTQNPRPSVIMCGNDVLAAGALTRAKSMGLRVPRDVSITGFDDIELASVVEPALTTVHVPHRAMGRQAARVLTDMIETDTRVRSQKLDARVVLRQSLAAPVADAPDY